MRAASIILSVTAVIIFGSVVSSRAADGPAPLSLDEFVELACSRDRVFEQILIDNLKLNYRKKLVLPADDIILSAKTEYVAFIRNEEKGYPVYEVLLSKLFPSTGTELETGYTSTMQDTLLGNIDAEFYARISQPVARNAFGKATRLLDKITGLEIDIARYQIIEAYENYLSSVIHIYYDWYEAYENLNTAENSYNENLKLLEDVRQRQKNNIALPVDVNKVRLQVLLKEETLSDARSTYDEYTNLIRKSIGYSADRKFMPVPGDSYGSVEIDLEKDYIEFREKSRTALMLDMLIKKSGIQVDKYADELLPSIDLFAEYSIKADDRRLDNDDKRVMAGVSIDYPFPGQVKHAEYETARVDHEKSTLEKINTHVRLYTQLRNIYREIKATRELIKIADKKIKVARSIVEDDRINYSYGKVILNNFIDEVNALDQNRFSKIQYSIRLKKLIIDWLTLTDRLVRRKELNL
jgi:outer membrane protein TolC